MTNRIVHHIRSNVVATRVEEAPSADLTYSTRWRSQSAAYASGGTLRYATRPGEKVTYQFTGSAFATGGLVPGGTLVVVVAIIFS